MRQKQFDGVYNDLNGFFPIRILNFVVSTIFFCVSTSIMNLFKHQIISKVNNNNNINNNYNINNNNNKNEQVS